MSVHYKFKAALDYSTVTFDGIHISVSDLKKEIIEQKRLGKNVDFDLQIQNAQTKDVYADESTLIPKNTSVIVARIPITEKKRSAGPPGPGFGRERFANQQRTHLASLPPAAAAKSVDLTSMDATEDEKIKAMMSQSTADYDPSRYMKIRGQNQHGKVPDGYTCYKCHKTGHWIKNCPVANHDDNVKKSTGIPRSFMVYVDGPQVPGALITPEGQYAVPAIDHEAYSGKTKAPQAEPPPKPKIPEDLICPLCHDLLTDALLVPCCANSYCDECIRGALLDSDDQECPGCQEKETSPNDLIPNRFLRSAVTAFKNETGYSKPTKQPEKADPQASPLKEAQAAAAAERKLSSSLDRIDDLPDDLFPHSPRRIDSDNADNADPTDSKDLYDFNDGSIPSPFAKDSGIISADTPKEHPGGPSQQFHGHSLVPPPPIRDFSRPPPNFRGPPSYGHGPPSQHDMRVIGQQLSEPPLPGFGDVPPPGEERGPSMRHGPPPHGHHPQHHGMGPQGPPMHGPSHGHMMAQGQQGSFNPMQPPPGFQGPPPGNMQRPPHMGGPPGPYHPGLGPYPPSGYNNRLPPPGDMYGHGPGPGPYQMDRHRDDYRSRGPPPPRRPFPGGRDTRMSGRYLPNDENRPGAIDDPLKEFERIMREKDRRKQMVMKKRSKSRSPPGHTPPIRRASSRSPSSPFRKRSMSPSYTRSPSPKRSRIYPLKRRNSFSRSRSRTPPIVPRRPPITRSRSREREREPMRSTSPHTRRRSPRRAPPYSPSPPSTSTRFIKKEKDEYYDHHSSSRFEDRERDRDRDRGEQHRDRHSRHPPPPSSSKHHSSSKEYDLKYEDSYRERERYDNLSSGRHDTHRDRYDYKSSTRAHPHHSSSNRGSPGISVTGHGRDREKATFENPPPRRIYEYEPSSTVPATVTDATLPPAAQPPPPSLFDLNITPPGTKSYGSKDHNPLLMEKSADLKTIEEVKSETIGADGGTPALQDEKKEHKRRKSSEEKKLKKEKKKHKKEEKKKEKSKRKKTTETLLPQPVIVGNDVETTLEMKLTAPCDSTVRSPDHRPIIKDLDDPLLVLNKDINCTAHEVITDHNDVEVSNLTLTSENENEFNALKTIDDFKPIVPTIPASKWDLLDDEVEVDPKTINVPVFGDEEEASVMKETKIPIDVLRRAENVIFDKQPITVQSISISVTEADNGKSKKITLTDIGTLPSEMNTSGHIASDEESKALSSAVFRKPVRDRLGNKVSEDEGFRSKDDDAQNRDLGCDKDREREREREKDKKYNRPGRRSRSRSPVVPAKRPREKSRSPRREKDRRQDLRPRSREREERDRDMMRDRARDQRQLPRRSRSRERDRERDLLLRDRADREKDRFRDTSSRRSRSRSRDRNRNEDRTARRPMARSPQPLFPIPTRNTRANSPELRSRNRGREYDSRIRNDESGDRDHRRRADEAREPTPPGVDKFKTNKDSKSRSSDKAHDGTSGVEAAFTNPFPGARKGKQRINIKLSSTSKMEKDSSTSSEEHEEENIYPQSSFNAVVPVIPSIPASVPQLVLPKSDEDGSKKKKKTKKRKSDSSSSSSESSDEKHKKSKKNKKKKKKKKKKSK